MDMYEQLFSWAWYEFLAAFLMFIASCFCWAMYRDAHPNKDPDSRLVVYVIWCILYTAVYLFCAGSGEHPKLEFLVVLIYFAHSAWFGNRTLNEMRAQHSPR